MKVHCVLLAITLLALCGVAEAQSHTWNGAADTPDWYGFSRVPETENPIVWVNNWTETIYQYPGDDPPGPGSWNWPGGGSTATVPYGEPDLHSDSAAVSSLEVNLGATALLRNSLQCITLNTAGLVKMGRDGRIFECAIQDNGSAGVIRSEKAYWATVADPVLWESIISAPVEIPNEMALGLWGNTQLNNIIKILSVSDVARLVIDSDVTLTGPGWVETSTSEDNEICNHYADGPRLTNEVTIHAAGKIGCNNIAVTNEALIVADRTNMLTIQPDDEPIDGLPGVINTGTLRATGGATIRLHRGVFDNTGGVIEAQDGSAVELHDYAHVSGGTLQTLGTGEIRPTGTGSSVSDVTVSTGSALVVPNSRKLRFRDTVTIDGQLRLESTGSDTYVLVRSPVLLNGAGEVVLSDGEGNRFSFDGLEGGYRLTSSIPISGATGEPGGLANGIALTNQSTITADGVNQMLLDPHDSPIDGLAGVINNGTLRALGGATMRLHDGSFDNTGGLIEAQDGSAVELHDYAHVSGGTLQTLGTGEIRPSGAGSSVSDLTVSAGSALVVPNSRKLRFRDTVTIDGELRLESTGSDTYVLVRSPVFLDGAGEVVLSDGEGNRFSFDGLEGGYRLTSAIPISGATGENGGLANGIALTNQSTITADGVNQMLLDPHDTPIDGLAGVINNGTLRAAGGATMRLQGGDFDNTLGVVEALDGSVVELHDAVRLTGGILQTSGSGAIRSSTGWIPPVLRNLTIEGRVEALGGAELGLGDAIVNNGVIEADDHVLPAGDLVLTGSGELRLFDGGQIRPDGNSVTNDTDHTIRATGVEGGDIHHALIHRGALAVDTGANLRLHEGSDAQIGSSTQVNGTLRTDVPLAMSGELSGNGTVNGSVNLFGSGILSPGSSTGTLTTTGNLTISDGATYRWQTSLHTGSDLVMVDGTLDLGTADSNVEISVTAGDVPDRVVLFTFDTLASTPGLSQFVLTDGYSFTGIDTSGDELALTGVTNPSFIFAEDFEGGNLDRWDAVQGSLLKSLRFDPAVNELNMKVSLPKRLVQHANESTMATGFNANGETVFVVVGRAGALRAGVSCAEGWRWSDWRTTSGSFAELRWAPGELWLYGAHGLIAGVSGTAENSQLTAIHVFSTGKAKVYPNPTERK